METEVRWRGGSTGTVPPGHAGQVGAPSCSRPRVDTPDGRCTQLSSMGVASCWFKWMCRSMSWWWQLSFPTCVAVAGSVTPPSLCFLICQMGS